MSTTTNATTTTSAPKTGLKYTYKEGDSYKDWYFANTGTEWDGTYLTEKPEDMSDVDWTQGMLMQQHDSALAAAGAQRDQSQQVLSNIYDKQTSAARASYNATANQYNQQMKNELEYAGVLHERMKKYLPQQMKAQGMGNMGVAQTAGANAAARHASNRGAIIGQNQASMNELSSTYGERQAKLDADYMKDMMGVNETYNKRVGELSDQRFTDDLDLFGQTVKDREEDLTEGENRLKETIEGATSRDEAQAWLDAAIADGTIRAESKSYFESLITNKFDKMDDENTQAGYDAAYDDLMTLYNQGASSVDLRRAYESFSAAGKIEPGKAQFWSSMIKMKEQEEADIKAGKISEEQKINADLGMMLLGEALTPEMRAEIMAGMAAQLATGKITQTQYDAAVAYCGVKDGNAEYLKGLEEQDAADAERAQLVDDIIGYIVGAAGNYAEAEEYFKEHGGGVEFTEAEERSIKIAFKTRQNMDEDEKSAKMTAEQSAAYNQCVSMLGMCKTTAQQLEQLEKFEDKLAPEVYEELKMVLEFQAEDPDVQAAEKEAAREDAAEAKGYGSAAEYDQAVLEGKEYVEYDGKQYKVNGEAVASDGKLIENEAFLEALKEKEFDNPNAKNIPNGTTVTFNIKPSKDGNFNWRDVLSIVAGLTGGVATGVGLGLGTNALLNYDMTLTYYNGSWYPVQSVEKK